MWLRGWSGVLDIAICIHIDFIYFLLIGFFLGTSDTIVPGSDTRRRHMQVAHRAISVPSLPRYTIYRDSDTIRSYLPTSFFHAHRQRHEICCFITQRHKSYTSLYAHVVRISGREHDLVVEISLRGIQCRPLMLRWRGGGESRPCTSNPLIQKRKNLMEVQ